MYDKIAMRFPSQLALPLAASDAREEEAAMAMAPKFIGAFIKRREHPRLITGTAMYVDDLQLPGTTCMAVLRSPYAHARLVRIDAQAARNDPRVLAVLTGDDVKDALSHLGVRHLDMPLKPENIWRILLERPQSRR